MSYDVASVILDLLCLYFISRDFFWRTGSKANGTTGPRAKQEVDKILKSSDAADVKQAFLLDLESRSKNYKEKFELKLKEMFKTRQQKQVTLFFGDLYASDDDCQQQLYFTLSLPYFEKKHFLKLVEAWRNSHESNPAKFLRLAYFHSKECGPLGFCTMRELRKKKKFRVGGKALCMSEMEELHGFKQLDFGAMEVQENAIPFVKFDQTKGLRFCTMKIKDDIEAAFGGKTWFTLHEMLDITPTTLFFICLISETIPEMDFAFANAPFEARVAKLIYPKIWQAWRENRIKELLFMGMNNWYSRECHADQPKWVTKAWKLMEPFAEHIEIKYVKGNFVNGQTREVINGRGYCCSVVHCKRHDS